MPFKELGLSGEILRGVEAMGFVDPTPIQLRAIPAALHGRDVIGSAQTGTGKTAAFAMPMLSQLDKHGALRGLILEPTRELAMQVETALRDHARFTEIKVGVIYGGVAYGPQKDAIQAGMDIIVATPGRLLDLMGQGIISLKSVRHLVLDEMDRMLDMGFLPDVRRIVEQCPKDRQTMMFSATMPPEVEGMTTWVLRDPEIIEIGLRRSPADTIRHALYPVAKDQKFGLLTALLERTNYDSVLIFTRTKHEADRIAAMLKAENHSVAVLHSNRTQRERVEALEGFKSGKYEVMVATDIASRGLDIAGVSHVVNYDVPQHPEDYVHRIGRTGRAQNVGDAFTLFTAEELDDVKKIERFIGRGIARLKIDDFKYVYTSLFNEKEAATALSARGARTMSGYSVGARKRRR